MRERILLYADDVAWPLWGLTGGPLHEDALPLSDAIKVRIKSWFNAYSEPWPDWPIWTAPAGSTPDEDERAWVAEGDEIRRLIERELGQPIDYDT